MSDYHFGCDGDKWVYPPLDDNWEMADWLEAVRVEDQLFIEASDAIAQVHALQDENAELRELIKALVAVADLRDCDKCPCQYTPDCVECEEAIPGLLMRDLGIEVE